MRQIVTIILLLLTLAGVGSVGLHLIEGADWLDCLFMSVITLTTVGYADIIDLSPGGKLFIMTYLVFGLGIFSYSLFQLGQWVVNAQMRSLMERRRMQRAIEGLESHFVICGLGRMGKTICRYLQQRQKPFVVIDICESRLATVCGEQGWPYIHGDATDDDVLNQAGVERARSLASVLPTDADNIYVILSARLLSAELKIIARASDEKAIEKMARAGANRVISPYSTGAEKIARFMLNPSIEDFLEIADEHGNELELADVQISGNNSYVGKRLAETDLREKGVMIIGIRRANGERLMPPPADTIIRGGDSLFAFGSAVSVNAMIGDSEADG